MAVAPSPNTYQDFQYTPFNNAASSVKSYAPRMEAPQAAGGGAGGSSGGGIGDGSGGGSGDGSTSDGGGRASFGPDGMVEGMSLSGLTKGQLDAIGGLLSGITGIPGMGYLANAINGSYNDMATEANAARSAQMDNNPDLNGSVGDIGAHDGPGNTGGQIGGAGQGGLGGVAGQGNASGLGGNDSGGGGGNTGGSDTGGSGIGGDGTGTGGDGDGAGYAKGGKVHKHKLKGPDPKGPDEGHAPLQSGEFVVRKSAVDKYGQGLLSALNQGKIPASKLRGLLG